MIKGAIFDLDGTLFDSMFIWENAGEEYLRLLGYESKENLREIFKTFSLFQSACYLKKHYGLKCSEDEIMCGINRMIEKYYREDIELKKGVFELLENLREHKIKMCIATATDKCLVLTALERCGIHDYFSEIFTCTSVGYSKCEPFIYRIAAEHMGTDRENTIVFEDAAYAIETAKNDGFITAGVYDASEEEQEKLKKYSDIYIKNFYDFDIWGNVE